MPATETHYQVLELSNTHATTDEIRDAYKSLALRWHPDKVSQEQQTAATERFKQIQMAYEILSNPESRTAYDESIILSHYRTFKTPPLPTARRKGPTTSFYLFETRSAALAFQQTHPSNDPANIYVYKGFSSFMIATWIRSYWIDRRKLLQIEAAPQGDIHIQTNDEASLKRIFMTLKKIGHDLSAIEPSSAVADTGCFSFSNTRKMPS